MAFERGVIIRLFILFLSMVAIVFLFMNKLYFTSSLMVIGLFFCLFNLFSFINKTQQSISHFLEIIKASDFSTSLENPKENYVLGEINQSFKTIIDAFKKARIEKESQHMFLQLIVDHIAIGLLSFDKQGNIILINESAKKLLGTQYFSNIQSLGRENKSLPDDLLNVRNGEQLLLKLMIRNQIMRILVKANELEIDSKTIKLVSLQDISAELDAQEIVAWQRLIRVLTHEIMNSISPITSLSSTISTILTNEINSDLRDIEALKDVLLGINTITKRGEGLLKFVESYRMLTQLPSPVFEEISVIDLMNDVSVLMSQELKIANVICMITVNPDTLVMHADRKMIEQALINLVKNAKEATMESENPEIMIKAIQNTRGNCIITIKDNGHGMEQELIDKIFVPFFTTKDKGTGIGLSLTRQIIQVHKGSINVISSKGEGTTVTLEI